MNVTGTMIVMNTPYVTTRWVLISVHAEKASLEMEHIAKVCPFIIWCHLNKLYWLLSLYSLSFSKEPCPVASKLKRTCSHVIFLFLKLSAF